MLQIIHCADFHLDSPFSGLDAKQSEIRREEQQELFRKLIVAVKNCDADILLISGDLFDSGFTSLKTVRFVSDMLATLSCPVVIAPGNHDPYTESGIYSSDFPDNVHIFKSGELSSFTFDELGVTVHGYAFLSEHHEANPLEGGFVADPTRINLLCAHADLDAPLSPYAPVTSRQLADSGLDYAALGHIHNAPAIRRIGKTTVAYSGCPEGRGFDETGFGGALCISIDGDTVDVKKLRLARRRYMIETIDISGVSDDIGTIERIRRKITEAEYGEETALRVILCGTVDLSYTPSIQKIAGEFPDLFRLDIRDETVPVPDASLEDDISIRGEYTRKLYRIMNEGTDDERRTAALALRIGLCALGGKPIVF